jgi:hypothetical protein
MNEHLLLAQEAEAPERDTQPFISSDGQEPQHHIDEARESAVRSLSAVRASMAAARPSRQRARLVPTHVR